MEGIGGMITYVGLAAGLAVIFWLIFRFKKQSDIAFEFLSPATTLAKSIAKMLIKDESKEEEVVKYIEILEAAVLSVKKKKEEIKEELPENATAKQRHAAYKEKALEIAADIAKSNGIDPDIVSRTIADTAIDLILSKLPKEEEITHVEIPASNS
jgi:cell division protein FtsN